jgi:hypothetical protein
MSIAESAVTPFTGNVREFASLAPRDVMGARNFSDTLTDYVESIDHLKQMQREDKEEPHFYSDLATNALGSGMIGATAGLGKGLLWDRGAGPAVLPTAAALGGIGVASSLVYGLLRRRLRNKRRESAYNTIVNTPAYVRDIYRYPDLQKKVREFADTRWTPYYGMEGGALAGSLASLAGGWASGASKSKNLALAAGGGIAGAGAGALLGYLLRERRRKQLLRSIESETMSGPE